MVEIDGSTGEGGGQVLRTALSLACVLGRPLRMRNIRRGRERPGLMPQHLACVRSAAALTGARVEGDEWGSLSLDFRPGPPRPGTYRFDIGTAGSASLVLQCVLPPLLLAEGHSEVVVTGGTHVPLSPPFDYLAGVFLPALGELGLRARAELRSHGFYPRGGGEVRASVAGGGKVRSRHFLEPGDLVELSGRSGVANLPLSIADRQAGALREALGGLRPSMETVEVAARGPGTFVFLLARYQHAVAGFAALGRKGKRAEAVGREAAQEFLAHHRSGAALDPYLADQAVLYLALAEGLSRFTTSRITSHLRTNLEVIRAFTGAEYEIEEPLTVTVEGVGFRPGGA
jgi:RNA 3'-terminal phosphate cyclase (ATP)